MNYLFKLLLITLTVGVASLDFAVSNCRVNAIRKDIKYEPALEFLNMTPEEAAEAFVKGQKTLPRLVGLIFRFIPNGMFYGNEVYYVKSSFLNNGYEISWESGADGIDRAIGEARASIVLNGFRFEAVDDSRPSPLPNHNTGRYVDHVIITEGKLLGKILTITTKRTGMPNGYMNGSLYERPDFATLRIEFDDNGNLAKMSISHLITRPWWRGGDRMHGTSLIPLPRTFSTDPGIRWRENGEKESPYEASFN